MLFYILHNFGENTTKTRYLEGLGGYTYTKAHEYLHKSTQNDQKILTQKHTKYLHSRTLFIF